MGLLKWGPSDILDLTSDVESLIRTRRVADFTIGIFDVYELVHAVLRGRGLLIGTLYLV